MTQGRADALRAMLVPASVAVVGASDVVGSFGWQMMTQLLEGGFQGRVYPVHPSRTEVLGHPCHPSLEALPEAVDLAVLGVPNRLLEQQLGLCARLGVRGAAVFASGHEETPDGRAPLSERLRRIAQVAEMAVCGLNCMGFVHVEAAVRACGFYQPPDLQPGPVTFLTHSGSAFSALLHNDRRIRFNLAVSCGQELVTTMADYLGFALEQPSTRVVALFLETVRDPVRFRAALDLAHRRDVAVVALKVGREAFAQAMVAAHSGALAGADGVFDAVCDAHGVIRVRTLDELLDTVELCGGGRRAGPGGLAAVHDSGGERAMLIDCALDTGVPLAVIGDATRLRLEQVLEPGLPAVNPLDAWGTGNRADAIYEDCCRILLQDPDTAALALVVDLTHEQDPEREYAGTLLRVAPTTDLPVALLSNCRSSIDRRAAQRLREAGVPVLEGTVSGLTAFRGLLERRDFGRRARLDPPEPVAPAVREEWRTRLARSPGPDPAETLALLTAYGIPTVPHRLATSPREAVLAADAVGWPVACKTAAAGVAHKTEVGGVHLGLADPAALTRAYRDLERRLGPRVLVTGMAAPGVELHLGVVRDPQFGPVVLVAAGGVLVEWLQDRRLALPPVDPAGALRLIGRLRLSPLLDGVRGLPAADRGAVARAVSRLSVLAQDLGDRLRALDVNPLIAGPSGCVAADALMVASAPGDQAQPVTRQVSG